MCPLMQVDLWFSAILSKLKLPSPVPANSIYFCNDNALLKIA